MKEIGSTQTMLLQENKEIRAQLNDIYAGETDTKIEAFERKNNYSRPD